MGLFDSLPAPSKRQVDSALLPSKKPRIEAQDQPQATSSALETAPSNGGGEGDGGGAASTSGGPWLGTLQAAYSEDNGSRLTMEDVAVISLEACTETTAACRLSYFAIFDGHGGDNVAKFAAQHLHACVMQAGLQQEAERLAAAASAAANTAASAAAAGAKGGPGGNSSPAAAQTTPPVAQLKACKAALTEGFRELDKRAVEACAASGWQDGCTAVVAYVLGNAMLVANVGDARCVLARRPQEQPGSGGEQQQQGQGTGVNASKPTQAKQQQEERQQEGVLKQQQGEQQQNKQQNKQPVQGPLKAITLTREHKAIFPQERQRIEKAGSYVSGDGRLAGRIEVSRAFGDRLFKKQGMIAVPDVQAFQLSPRDAFLLLACDGFWGVFSPQDAVDYAAKELFQLNRGVKQTCNRLIYEAIRERKCKDNCTVMLVAFGDC